MSEPQWTPRTGVPIWRPIGSVKGPPGAGATYEHEQTTPATNWTIVHNLRTFSEPLVLIDSVPGEPVYTDIEFTDENTLVLRFPAPETGRAFVRN